ncbi:YjbQ family protein [Methylomarinum sp. Ch1-1]|uniref:YjbQ family protein n=1 Tax=Methylomarinum roseum TaxID=3067653 RepID=A0AAU7NYX1_9GAMM|nr:YjbQ family protein [Methylomarinum sp. Ch1-1]MDP4521692.1 YjbQ family protein [Methylomarinum sp. Ch1-1]
MQMIEISSHQREQLIDITEQVKAWLRHSSIRNGLVNVYAQGATAAIMIQENWDDSVQADVVDLLRKLIPRGVWLHDRQGRQRRFSFESGLGRAVGNHPDHRWRIGLVDLAEYLFL